jgi:hypothetical protein
MLIASASPLRPPNVQEDRLRQTGLEVYYRLPGSAMEFRFKLCQTDQARPR